MSLPDELLEDDCDDWSFREHAYLECWDVCGTVCRECRVEQEAETDEYWAELGREGRQC